MIDYGTILAHFYGDYVWQCRDIYNYDSILWQDGRMLCPTKEELESKQEQLILDRKLMDRKETLKMLLNNSDWCENQSSQILLENHSEWMNYRVELKKLLITKDVDSQIPDVPLKKWKT